ncbi:hypothetical protein ACHAWF_007764 [Thalassiosira exigua]
MSDSDDYSLVIVSILGMAIRAWCWFANVQWFRQRASAPVRRNDAELRVLRQLEKRGMIDAEAAASYYEDATTRVDSGTKKEYDDFTFVDFILGRAHSKIQFEEEDGESEISLAPIRENCKCEKEAQKS